VALPLPKRRNIGPYAVWPGPSLDTIVHNNQVISVDNLFDMEMELDSTELTRAAEDLKAAVKSAKRLSRCILKSQAQSVVALRGELEALMILEMEVEIKTSGNNYDLLLPLAKRLDELRFGDWEVGRALALSRLIHFPENVTLQRRPSDLSVVWRDGAITLSFRFVGNASDSWSSVEIYDRNGLIEYSGLDTLSQRLIATCPDPDSAVTMMEFLDLVISILKEGGNV